MTKEELEKLAESYQKKADRAEVAYQETGITRYRSQWEKNEDLADALRMAADAREDREALSHFRADLSQMGARAQKVLKNWSERDAEALLRDMVALARMRGLI